VKQLHRVRPGGSPAQLQQSALDTRRRSTCRRQTAGAAHSLVAVIVVAVLTIEPSSSSQARHSSPRLRIPFRIHQVLTRSTPPRWRVAVQQAGADAGTHDLSLTVDEGDGKVNRRHVTCPGPQAGLAGWRGRGCVKSPLITPDQAPSGRTIADAIIRWRVCLTSRRRVAKIDRCPPASCLAATLICCVSPAPPVAGSEPALIARHSRAPLRIPHPFSDAREDSC